MGHASLATGSHAAAADPTAVLLESPPLGAAEARAYLRRCVRIVGRHARALTRLDEALGDGDHGDNLLAGFSAVEDWLDADGAGEDDLSSLLRSAGAILIASVGGASGPLYGSAFMEAGFAARGLDEQTPRIAQLAALLEAAAAGLARRGHCRIGDKTIYDALAPATAALRAAVARGADEGTAIRETATAGARGMRDTTPLVARRGLAMRLGERSRGRRDPGAASCLLLVRALGTRREMPGGRGGA